MYTARTWEQKEKELVSLLTCWIKIFKGGYFFFTTVSLPLGPVPYLQFLPSYDNTVSAISPFTPLGLIMVFCQCLGTSQTHAGFLN